MSLLRGTHLRHLACLRLHVLRAYCNFKSKEVILKTLFGLCPNNKGCQWNFSEVEYVRVNKVWKKLSSCRITVQILSCQWSVYQKLHNRCSFFTNIVNGLLSSKCPGSSNCTVISHFIFIPPGAKGEHFKSILWLGERVPWEPWQTGNVGWDENLKEDLSLGQAVAKVY